MHKILENAWDHLKYVSEIVVQKIVQVLQNTSVDLFNAKLKRENIYNLASNFPIGKTANDCLLFYKQRGKAMMEEFKTRILIEMERNGLI